jgi:hypothetical protein
MTLTQDAFVAALKSEVRTSVESTIEYFCDPPGFKPQEPLNSLSRWFRTLSATDQDMVRTAMEYAADGSLFGMLSLLDGVSNLKGAPGSLELYYCHENVRRRLNDPDEGLLHEQFNNLP